MSDDTAADSSMLGQPGSNFVGVVIPAEDMEFKKPAAKKSSKSTTSSTNSPATISRETSNEYETPSTSAATTPAASSTSRRQGFSKMKGKRKIEFVDDSEDEDTSGDARLARMRQEEEYSMPPPPKRAKKAIKDEDDEDVMMLESDQEEEAVLSDASEDVSLSTLSKSSKQKPRKNPSTKAASAKSKSTADVKGKGKAIVVDSEDESALSDFVEQDDEDFDAENVHFDGESVTEESAVESVTASDVGEASWVGRRRGRLAAPRVSRRERGKMNRAARERVKLEKAHPEIKTMWDTLRAIPKIETAQVEQPPHLTLKLKSYQLEGVHWMRQQEQTQWKGGLLGDEMGMGKTIQTVALMMSDYPAKKPTLVVVPPVALMQWSNEINMYTNGKLKVLVYHGTNNKAKSLSMKELKKYDVIMISYSGLESIHRKETKGWSRGDKIIKEDSTIHAIDFHRLILDEAHSIKSRTTGVAKACFALKGDYKWCLSGTPVQNRIGEFFSLLRFLEVTPYANYFCKSCSCSAMHWSINAEHRCTMCNHRGLDHVSVFNQEILNPITTPNDSTTPRTEALAKLRLLTDRIMLRRVKRDYTASMELPPKEVVIHNEFFGEIERDFSSSIMSNTARTFDTYVSRGVMLNNYANIFGLIMQMRQVADHPDLLLKRHAEGGQNVLVCNICDEPAEEAIRSRCKHEFCRACAKDYVQTCEASGADTECPRCHIALAIDFDQPDIEQDEDVVKKSSIINRIKMGDWTSSTKIEMLVYDLYKLRSKKQTLKSIVFSQFTSMLQLIEWRLRRAGFNTVMLDGSMSPAQRQKSIEYFMNNTDVEVFLVSLKAGGVALNLVEASRVFIVDPWWNPAAEVSSKVI